MRTFFAILGLAAGAHGQANRGNGPCGDAVCTEQYEPGCYEDVTYSNRCVAASCVSNLEAGRWTDGPCPNVFPPPPCATPSGRTINGGARVTDAGDACTFYECVDGVTRIGIIDCAPPQLLNCQNGTAPFTRPGECCPSCRPARTPTPPPTPRPCDEIMCTMVACDEGTMPFTRPGECCPSCRARCDLVRCGRPECQDGSVEVTRPGECCPVCRPDRSPTPTPSGGITCPMGIEYDDRVCNRMLNRTCAGGINYNNPCHALGCGFREDEISVGLCDDTACAMVDCPAVACEEGTIEFTRPGECCPSCRPARTPTPPPTPRPCDEIMCTMVACDEGTVPFTQPGECCPSCRPEVTNSFRQSEAASVVRRGDDLVVHPARGGAVRLLGNVFVGMEALDLLTIIRRQETEIANQRSQLQQQQRQINRIVAVIGEEGASGDGVIGAPMPL